MKIKIKNLIIEEGILSGLAEFGNNLIDQSKQNIDPSSKMNSRAEQITPLTPEQLMSKATGFKKENGEMAITKSERDFKTGSKHGTQSSAEELFKDQRNLLLNK